MRTTRVIAFMTALPASVVSFKKFLWVMGWVEPFPPETNDTVAAIIVGGYFLSLCIFAAGELDRG